MIHTRKKKFISVSSSFSPLWDKCATVDGDQTKAHIPDLMEGNVYEFRVVAVNKAGPGNPSEPTKPHVARPKNRE